MSPGVTEAFPGPFPLPWSPWPMAYVGNWLWWPQALSSGCVHPCPKREWLLVPWEWASFPGSSQPSCLGRPRLAYCLVAVGGPKRTTFPI